RTAIPSLDAPVRVAGDLTYNAQKVGLDVQISSLRAAMAGTPTALKAKVESELLNADFDGQMAGGAGQNTGVLRASGPNLRQLPAWWGTPIVGGVGFEQFAVSGRITVNGPVTAFSNAGFSLAHIRGRGDFDLSSRHNKPYISGRLQLFDLDL